MSVLAQLTAFLDAQQVGYEIHSSAYPVATQPAKAVMVRAGAECLLAITARSSEVSLDRLAKITGNRRLRFATRFEVAALFPGCSQGSLPPFGNLYDLPVWIDTSFAPDGDIAFQVGTPEHTVLMRYADFARLAQPRIASFSFHMDPRSPEDA
ncbi:MAG TPA: YbaK/EbsC family protein [Candidatus Binatia bacterium]|nr:YbaK/EbsC family protein [Candidatus Binatia bacterium]